MHVNSDLYYTDSSQVASTGKGSKFSKDIGWVNMISFSPTQKKAGKAFYSESSTPVQWIDCLKNDYKLN